jgi:RNA polymerase sigma factor (sigma-70 family)
VDGNGRAGARLTSLYEAHAADAFRFALHLTGRREDAEDVVQHVFLQAYAVLEEGRELVNPRAWLMKATKHRSLNLIRDRRDTPAADIEPPAPFGHDENEAEALTHVRAALWSLPEPQHQAFVLRHWSGLSQDEIADVLATTPGAVESLLVRARAALVAERAEGDGECAGVRGRLARMLAPTPAHSAHLAGCRRCRTAQTRLLRAAEFATTFALVPGPHVLHSLSAAIPGFGVSGAAAGASATGAAAGTGSGGAAVSAVSAATKAGLLTKVAVVATTAAVAVTAVHPLRTAVTHEIFHHTPATAMAAAPTRHAAHTASTTAGGVARADAAGPVAAVPGLGGADPTTTAGGTDTTTAPTNDPPAKTGAGNGKSGTAGSNGNGNGNGPGQGNGQGKGKGKGTGSGATHGKSATAPGHTGAHGNGQANGAGNGKGKGAANGNGGKPQAGAGSTKPDKTKTNPGNGGTKTPPADGTSNGNGNGNGAAGSTGNGNGAGTGNAGGNGKGNGKP